MLHKELTPIYYIMFKLIQVMVLLAALMTLNGQRRRICDCSNVPSRGSKVCGVNRTTYANRCALACAGVGVCKKSSCSSSSSCSSLSSSDSWDENVDVINRTTGPIVQNPDPRFITYGPSNLDYRYNANNNAAAAN